VLLFALAQSRQYKVLAAIVTSFAMGLMAIGYRGLGYGWYFMPTVAASFVLAVNTIPFEAWAPKPRRVLAAVLTLALLVSATTSLGELRTNRARESLLLAQDESAACVLSAVARLKPHDRLLLLVDPASTMFDWPDDDFMSFHDAIPLMQDPPAFKLERAVVVTTQEMERQHYLVAQFMRSLRERGARIHDCGSVLIAY
jgi:hypothetical protein